MEGTILLENSNTSSYYTIKEGLFNIENNTISITFTNKNRFTLEIKKNKYLADVETINFRKINHINISGKIIPDKKKLRQE